MSAVRSDAGCFLLLLLKYVKYLIISCNICKTFVYRNELTGEKETYIAVIHYSAAGADEVMQRDILDAAIEWFCRWIRWEDGNVSSDMTSQLN